MSPSETVESPLTIRLFGPLDVRINGHPLPRLRSRKGQWLLALLVLREGREVDRAWLAGTLWPESPEPLALSSLRQTLADLRRALGDNAVRLQSPTPHSLRLHLETAEADVLVFDAAIARQGAEALSQAIRLYQGTLLEGCTEEWVVQERRPREQAFLRALETLAARAMESQDSSAAIPLLRRLVATDPLREDAHRSLMAALAGIGDYAAAIQVYRDLRLHLHAEIHEEPAAETTALFQRLRVEARQQAEESDLPAALPSTTTPVRRHLPQPLTALIGRAREIQEIQARLASGRLVTLTGAGGIGKTRLAVQVATQSAADYPEGAWFVDLAALTDPTLVPQSVATTLGVREDLDRPILTTLTDYLRPRHLLLILDNCEHLIRGCTELVQTLLQNCPHLRILATSQQALGLTGETAWRVPSLALPNLPEDQNARPTTLLQYAAIALFIERARAALPDFTLNERNAQATVQVCRRLDGIPLAIELAAARLKVLTVEQIAARLDDRFQLLTGGSSAALPRQQTLRAALDWSIDLLSDAERVLLRRLSVFAGGASLEAVEAVCVGGSVTVEAVLDLLTQLVDKSFIWVEDHHGTAHYRLFETTREYGRERLEVSGEAFDLRRRHAYYFRTLAQQSVRRFERPGHREALDCLETSHDDLRAALEWFIRQAADKQEAEAEAGLQLASNLASFWHQFGYVVEGRRRLETLLSHVHLNTPPHAYTLAYAAMLSLDQGDLDTANHHVEQALAIYQKHADINGITWMATLRGRMAAARGDFETARHYYHESLDLSRTHNRPRGVATALNNLGLVAYWQGDYTAAEEYHTQCLEMNRKSDNDGGTAWSLDNLGDVFSAQGDQTTAKTYFTESLRLFHQLRNMHGIGATLMGLAYAIARTESSGQADILRAARLLGAAEIVRESMGSPIAPTDRLEYDQLTTSVRARLDPDAFAATWAEGRALTLEQAIAYALESPISN